MEIHKIREKAGWYSSWMDDPQGRALVKCMEARIKVDDALFQDILAEIELTDDPVEHTPNMILESIRDMIHNRQSVSTDIGYFKWEG
jgi:hypothetical protein